MDYGGSEVEAIKEAKALREAVDWLGCKRSKIVLQDLRKFRHSSPTNRRAISEIERVQINLTFHE